MVYADKSVSRTAIPPSHAWLILFLPSFVYYIHRLSYIQLFRHSYPVYEKRINLPTPSSSFSSSSSTDEASRHQQSLILHDLFYISKTPQSFSSSYASFLELSHPLEILETRFHSLSGLTYVHDDDLGRGYLLLSDSNGSGRIWRWEIGGGPIAIGTSLHMERSGCRSLERRCDDGKHRGSGAMEWLEGGGARENQFILSEFGEQRLIRLEDDGARTPLLVNVTVLNMVFMPPFGDAVLVMEEESGKRVLKKAAFLNVEKLTPKESKKAHKFDYWEGKENRLVTLQNFLTNEMDSISGVDMFDWDYVLVTGEVGSRSVIFKVFVGEDEDEEEEEEIDKEDENHEGEEVVDVKDRIGDEEENNNEKTDKDLDTKLSEDLNNHKPSVENNQESQECESSQDVSTEGNVKETCQSHVASKNSLFFDATPYFDPSLDPKMRGIVVDSNGNIYVLVSQHGIMILSPDSTYLGTIPFTKDEDLVDLIFGKDGYLYIVSKSSFFRIKTKAGKNDNLQGFQNKRL